MRGQYCTVYGVHSTAAVEGHTRVFIHTLVRAGIGDRRSIRHGDDLAGSASGSIVGVLNDCAVVMLHMNETVEFVVGVGGGLCSMVDRDRSNKDKEK